MFPKVVLTSLILGVLSANALSVPLARSPAHKFPNPLSGPDLLDRREPAPELPGPDDYDHWLASLRREPAPEPHESFGKGTPHGGDPRHMARQDHPFNPPDFLKHGVPFWMPPDPSMTGFKPKREPSGSSPEDLVALATLFARDDDHGDFLRHYGWAREPEPLRLGSAMPSKGTMLSLIGSLGMSNMASGALPLP